MAQDALEDMSGPLTQYLVVLLRQLSLCDPLQFRGGQRTVLQQDDCSTRSTSSMGSGPVVEKLVI